MFLIIALVKLFLYLLFSITLSTYVWLAGYRNLLSDDLDMGRGSIHLFVPIVFTTITCLLVFVLGPIGALIALPMSWILTFILYRNIYIAHTKKKSNSRKYMEKIVDGDEAAISTAFFILIYPLMYSAIVVIGLAIR
jgi:hypothetical protein